MITVETQFDMAHRVADFSGGEDSIHGHTFKVEAAITKLSDGSHLELDGDEEALNDEFPLDPTRASNVLKNAVEPLKHSLMVHNQDENIDMYRRLEDAGNKIHFVDFSPSAFNIARYIYNEIEGELLKENMHCDYVKLVEGSFATALYTEYRN